MAEASFLGFNPAGQLPSEPGEFSSGGLFPSLLTTPSRLVGKWDPSRFTGGDPMLDELPDEPKDDAHARITCFATTPPAGTLPTPGPNEWAFEFRGDFPGWRRGLASTGSFHAAMPVWSLEGMNAELAKIPLPEDHRALYEFMHEVAAAWKLMGLVERTGGRPHYNPMTITSTGVRQVPSCFSPRAQFVDASNPGAPPNIVDLITAKSDFATTMSTVLFQLQIKHASEIVGGAHVSATSKTTFADHVGLTRFGTPTGVTNAMQIPLQADAQFFAQWVPVECSPSFSSSQVVLQNTGGYNPVMVAGTVVLEGATNSVYVNEAFYSNVNLSSAFVAAEAPVSKTQIFVQVD